MRAPAQLHVAAHLQPNMLSLPYGYYPTPYIMGIPLWSMLGPVQAQVAHQPPANLVNDAGPIPPVPNPSVEYPKIVAWLAHCNRHPSHSGEDFSELLPKFDKEGFRCIHQLTGNQITVEKLAEWVGIGKGTADLLIRYAEEDIELVKAGRFVLSDCAI